MQVERSFKYVPEPNEYGSEGFSITLSHEELGLEAPNSPETARALAGQLAQQAEAIILIEKVKHGRINREQVHETVRRWTPPNVA